jgi:hypothetical protein
LKKTIQNPIIYIMNKQLLIACLVGLLSFLGNNSNAQVSINFNIGTQPLWGPVGYDQANYYYLPDIDTYYSVPARQYVYLQNGGWVFTTALPSRYRGYNLYNGYKVVLNNTERPYLYNRTHKIKYAKFKGYRGKQPTIRYSNNPKYFVVKGHPKHGRGMSARPARSVPAMRSKAHYSGGASSGGNNGKSKGQGNGEGHGGGKGHGKGKH